MGEDDLKREELAAEFSSKSDEELKDLLDKFYAEEERISYKRRILHGKIDILRAEIIRRLKDKQRRGEKLFTSDDIAKLSEILARGATGVSRKPIEEDLF